MGVKEKRKSEIKKRKNFLPSLLITAVAAVCIAGLVFLTDPGTLGTIPLFFLLTFLFCLFLFSLVFANTRRGLLSAILITTFLLLRFFGIGNLLNLLLLTGILGALEIVLYSQFN